MFDVSSETSLDSVNTGYTCLEAKFVKRCVHETAVIYALICKSVYYELLAWFVRCVSDVM